MNNPAGRSRGIASLIVALLLFLLPSPVNAHCDTMNGPVVTAGRKALETGNLNLALIWVQKKDEAEIRAAFQRARAVRALSSEARALADLYFFETLVRVHRAGEGVAYTGLKPAEGHVEPGIAAADHSLEAGSSEALLSHIDGAVREGIHRLFEQAMRLRNFKPDDVDGGRAFVNAYVQYIHYVERLYQAASMPAAGHLHETEESDHH